MCRSSEFQLQLFCYSNRNGVLNADNVISGRIHTLAPKDVSLSYIDQLRVDTNPFFRREKARRKYRVYIQLFSNFQWVDFMPDVFGNHGRGPYHKGTLACQFSNDGIREREFIEADIAVACEIGKRQNCYAAWLRNFRMNWYISRLRSAGNAFSV